MKSICIFLICLIASSQAVSYLRQMPLNYGKERNIMAVLMEVQSKMQDEGALDAVTQVLDSFKDEISKEQKDHEVVANGQRTSCNDEFSFRKKEIADGTTALEQATQQLHNCQTSLRQAEVDLAQNLDAQATTRAALESAINNRRQENELYLRRVSEHKDAIVAIDTALSLLDEIFSGSKSFVELKQITTSLFQSAVNLRKAEHFAPVLSVFAQMAQNKVLADTAALEKVRELLKSLKDRVQASWDEYRGIEEKQETEYQRRKAQLEEQLASLKRSEEALRGVIADMKVCIGKQTSIINSATEKVKRNNDLLTSAQKMCEDFEADFKAASEKRKNELDLVARIKEIVLNRYKQISQQVTERGLQAPEQWAKHQNRYQYDPAEAFRRVRGLENAEGQKQANFSKNEQLAALQINKIH